MSHANKQNTIECIILAGGLGVRIGKGPKAFIKIGEQTLLEIAVSSMPDVVSKIIVAVPFESLNIAKEILSNDQRVSVITGGDRRIDTLRILIENSTSNWLILHDVVHPLTSHKIIQDVVDAAFNSGAAAAALPIHEFVYNSTGEKVSQPGASFIVQKPIVFQRNDALAGFKRIDEQGESRDLSILEVLSLAGLKTSFVQGSQLNQKITNQSDLDFALIIQAGQNRFNKHHIP